MKSNRRAPFGRQFAFSGQGVFHPRSAPVRSVAVIEKTVLVAVGRLFAQRDCRPSYRLVGANTSVSSRHTVSDIARGKDCSRGSERLDLTSASASLSFDKDGSEVGSPPPRERRILLQPRRDGAQDTTVRSVTRHASGQRAFAVCFPQPRPASSWTVSSRAAVVAPILSRSSRGTSPRSDWSYVSAKPPSGHNEGSTVASGDVRSEP